MTADAPHEEVEPEEAAPLAARGGDLVYRHRWPTRIWHWLNALTVFVLLMSGLMIFNAHPRLYWGEYGANADHAWLQIGGNRERGYRAGRQPRDPDHGRSRPLDRCRTAISRPGPSPAGRRFPAATTSPARAAGISCSPGCWSSRPAFLAVELHQPPHPARPRAEAGGALAAPYLAGHQEPCPPALPHRRGGARTTISCKRPAISACCSSCCR